MLIFTWHAWNALFCYLSDFVLTSCSATWPPGVRRLINDYMKEGPFQVTVGTLDLRVSIAHSHVHVHLHLSVHEGRIGDVLPAKWTNLPSFAILSDE